MRTFPIDNDLVAMVWQAAKPQPFESLTFNDALRRILSTPIAKPTIAKEGVNGEALLKELENWGNSDANRKRAPRADLRQLVKLGKLKEGQDLYFIDYRGNLKKDARATISGQDLVFAGQRYSMTALAREFLQESGFAGGAVRGPAHWALKNGTRVQDLWQAVLE